MLNLKMVMIILIFQLSTFANKPTKSQTIDLTSIDSMILNFVKIDNSIDELILNANDISISHLSQIKKDIDDVSAKQFQTLTNLKISKESKDKFKLMKLYSLKIKTKFMRLKKSLGQTYRMSPSSHQVSKGTKDIVLNSRKKEDIKNQIDEIIKSSNKLISSSKWLYNISK